VVPGDHHDARSSVVALAEDYRAEAAIAAGRLLVMAGAYDVPMRTAVVVALLAGMMSSEARADSTPRVSADDALQTLLAGNHAFVTAGATCPRQTTARRSEVAAEQHPIAVVIGCADSRVPPEAIFGQGIGDLFVIRVAGNVIDDAVLGSVEYAVEHLGASLVVVLGHSKCGAVKAALAAVAPPPHLDALVGRIRPAIEHARQQKGGDALDNAVRANVAASVHDVLTSRPVLAPLVAKGLVKVVGARYDLDTGAVEVLRP
jgi:carbonic anhydrase